MRRHAAGRTDASLRALFAYLDRLEIEIRQGRGPEDPLDFKTVSTNAGVGPKFLYGKKHNQSFDGAPSTKDVVEDKLKSLNKIIVERKEVMVRTSERDDADSLKSEAAYWKERYEKLARHTNLWFARIREQQRAIRRLKGQQ
jgi:hypothetical protein